jgi:ATP-dependent RNA helicase SUPV3L1/SUV3
MTGQECLIRKDACFFACTVELCPKNEKFECAVVDEIQMIGDPERGWAWTKALLSLQAREIHLCGDSRAVALVKSIADRCGDEFQVCEYRRLSKLNLAEDVYDWKQSQPGDCLIDFSASSLLRLREEANRQVRKSGDTVTGGTSLVYGKLPP